LSAELTTILVSEAIGLEIVAFNHGSYTGAILFTGFMYIGAAVSLWMVRAWKIGELEKQAAIDGKGEGDATRSVPDGFKRSTFAKRLIAWRKV
jgi:hypothetical protein